MDDDKELEQRYEFARSIFGWFVAWFGTFGTLNGAVFVGLLSSTLGIKLQWPVALFFVVQNALGIAGCWCLARYINDQQKRIATVVAADPERDALPSGFFKQCAWLMAVSCFVQAVIWAVVFILNLVVQLAMNAVGG
jgi:hypothetical protein